MLVKKKSFLKISKQLLKAESPKTDVHIKKNKMSKILILTDASEIRHSERHLPPIELSVFSSAWKFRKSRINELVHQTIGYVYLIYIHMLIFILFWLTIS